MASMDDPTPRSETPGFPPDDGTYAVTEPAVPPRPQYIAYRPPNSEFTPPASPQPHQSPYAAKKGFSSHRSKLPANLQMDTAVAPAYERPQYSPSPSSSPPLPPALPSPKFPNRSRAPSLLRHAAVSSPLNEGFPRAEQPSSPTFASPMMRQASNTSASSDPRSFFNPLASNPVGHNGPSWDSSSEDQLGDLAHHQPQHQRMRAMTNSSQNSFVPHPLLRAATSIPDYAPFRNGERSNLSGTYKPNRGGANWSHTDYYPPPMRFRGEEGRASYRSGRTNASSFMEASGTERSSMATGRSSISEYRESTYSRDPSRDRSGERSRDHSQVRNISPETTQTTDMENDDDVLSAVEDVIDAYCYDDAEDEERREHSRQLSLNALSSSPIHLDSEPPGLSQTPSRDHDSLDSFKTSDHTRQWDSMSQHNLDLQQTVTNKDRISGSPKIEADDLATNDFNASIEATLAGDRSSRHTSYLPRLQQLSPINVQYDADVMEYEKSEILHRASEELPRRASGMRLSTIPVDLSQHQHARVPSASRSQMQDIHKELKNLPRFPTKKSRMSRQDWADIEAYSKRHSKRPSGPRPNPEELVSQSPPKKISDPLPEVDQDEAFPRRASTSVYDRKSTLLLLGAVPPPPPAKPAAAETVTPTSPIARRPIGRILSPVERDRYGFKKATDKISVAEYDAWSSKYEEHISRRRNKWIALMNKQGLSTTNPVKFPEQCEKVKRYARKGYPPEWRGAMWWYYSGGQYMMNKPEITGLYATLVKRVNNGELNKDDREAIERDLDRTFPDNIHFRPDPTPDGKPPGEPVLIQDLREVLSAFALHYPSIGYCQSLNFIAGLLLLFLKQDNERVFILLTIITQNHLPGAHARSLANTEVNVLMMLIKDYLPKVWASINDTDLINSGAGSHAHPDSKFQRQPTIALSCTSWFMSIFVGVLPVETVLRVWDAFLYEGPRALYRYALAIFKLGEPEIRKYRPGDGELFMTVQNLPRRCLDPNVLHDLGFVKKGFGSLTQNVIDQKRMFWRDQNKMGHQTSIRRIETKEADTESVSKRGAMSGLRRKASRKLLRRK